ncbi:hypothetical protein A3D77_04940 [Candidatus Gottesmanbacteria bacterium RIFCSPHIGHO2_02_FULL_39_11]|uniref:DUF6922 domain-containing protein n=1 Tax=Candidatus Gottesmanbacteria bacterium RIFCSPHIGHO2_02_FULL_39_11 TaxID=1798382 RepID=A0A1F5ZM55_9BACT|nr:MAG: hypothetical protein A3D77_04940 [Candidatus Gottesmanbacteria bacterium RIFCSPHIGHO2_02_FULL_39_11]
MSRQKSLPTKLPREFHRFFWDVEASQVNPSKLPYYVVNRLLDKGNLDAARWVLSSFPKETIVETFRKVKDFSPWNGVFWANYLEIPRKEVRCLDPSYLTMRRKLWQY